MFVSHVSSLYHEDSRIGDLLVQPQRWCHHQWQHVTSPLAKNPSPYIQVIARICYALLLILPTLGAYTFGLFGVLIKNFQVQPTAASQILTLDRSQQTLPVSIPVLQSLPAQSSQGNSTESSSISGTQPYSIVDFEKEVDRAIDALDFAVRPNSPHNLHKEILRPAIRWLIQNSFTSWKSNTTIEACAIEALNQLRFYLDSMMALRREDLATETCFGSSLTCIATKASRKDILEIPSKSQSAQMVQRQHKAFNSKYKQILRRLSDINIDLNIPLIFADSTDPGFIKMVKSFASKKASLEAEKKQIEESLEKIKQKKFPDLNICDEDLEQLGITPTGLTLETSPENLFTCLMEAFEKNTDEGGLWLFEIPQHAMFLSTTSPLQFADSGTGLLWSLPNHACSTKEEFCLSLTVFLSLCVIATPEFLIPRDNLKPLKYRFTEFKKLNVGAAAETSDFSQV